MSPPTDRSRPAGSTGGDETVIAATAISVPHATDAAALDTPHRREDCAVWLIDEAGAAIGKCPQHFPTDKPPPAMMPGDAPAIARRLIIQRADSKPDPFVAEDVVSGLPLTRNAIGGIVSRLARDGKIVKVGYIRARSRSRHGATVCRWSGAKWIVAGPPAHSSEVR